jgi:predicted  nucleic acid-binding Zn-ribbon protein
VDPEPTEPAPAPPARPGVGLLDLQELDLSIDRMTARVRQLEGQGDLRAARAELSQAEARLGEVRLAMEAIGLEQRRLEGDIEVLDRRIEAERRRLFDGSVANPKELQAIEAEIRNLEGRKGRAEDLLLEQMERWEGMESRLPAVTSEEAHARQRLTEVGEGAAKELDGLEHALAARRAERQSLLPAFDPELLELYEELRRQKQGVGAASLVDGVCQACHQKLSPMYLDRMKRSEGVRRCEYCRRILVT